MDLKAWTKTAKHKEFHFVFFDLVLLILPGAGIIFLFDRSLFLSLDWVKLVLLSGAIMAPLSFINTLFISAIDDQFDPKKKDALFVELSLSILITSVALYIFALYGYFVARNSVNFFLILVIASEVLMVLWGAHKEWRRGRRKEKASS